MIKHLWSILCKDHSLDETTNNISLFNVVEEIGIQKDQIEQIKLRTKEKDGFSIPFGLTLITLLKRDGKNDKSLHAKVKIVLKDPQDKIMLEHERDIEFIADKKRLRLLTTLTDIKLSEAGEYVFFISLKENGNAFKEIGSLPLEVKF